MADLNKVLMIGRLTRDPKMNYLPSGTAKAELSLASNREWTRDGNKKKETCFVDIVVWGRLAETVDQYLTKGRQILVEGRLSFSRWEKDGEKRSKHEIVAEHIQFLDKPTKSSDDNGTEEVDPDEVQF